VKTEPALDLLLLGIVMKAHGLRGEVVVQPHHAGSPLWKPGLTLHAVTRELADKAIDRISVTPMRTLRLKACRSQITGGETSYLCLFEGVADRDAAEALRSFHLAVDPALVPALADDEFYHHELRGYAVQDVAGVALGTIVGVLEGPAQDLLEVAPAPTVAVPKPETWFVPFVDALVKSVSREQRLVVIDPPEGLIP
jgi:16S rRNA processing protein RimM